MIGMVIHIEVIKKQGLYYEAADLGYSNAMNNIGFLYENGLGVKKDLSKAQEWYDKSAAAE